MTIEARIEKLSPAKRRLLHMMRPQPGAGPYPLSYGQQRLWFINQLEPWNTAYNVLAAVRLSGSVSVPALEYAVSEIVRRHEVLRTRFDDTDGQVVQRVDPPAPVAITCVDVTGLSGSDWRRQTRVVAEEHLSQPFDLRRGPMLRATLIHCGDDSHVCLLAIHHIVCDGWSSRILTQEVVRLYTSYMEGQPPDLPELPLQYGQYAIWEREREQRPEATAHTAYWRDRLAGMEVLRLPVDREPPRDRRYEGARDALRLDAALSGAIRALGARTGTTLFMTLLAAFDIVLAHWSGQRDIVIGTDIANRNRKQFESLIGFFVNQIVLRTRVEPAMTTRELLAAVRSTALEAYAHQEVPFERVVEAMNPERSLHQSPLFSAKLIMQNMPVGRSRGLQGITVEPVALEATRSQIDLLLSALDTPSGVALKLIYSTDVYDAATMQRFLGHLQLALAQMVDDDQRRISQFELLAPAERAQLLRQGQGGASGAGSEGLATWLTQQVAARAEAVAATCGTAALTYGALAARAAGLAATLRRLGVGPEVRVGLCAARGLPQLVGLLGIVQSGGAYVPLEPSAPPARLAAQVEDAGLAVLVTEQAWRSHVATPAWVPVVELEAVRAARPVRWTPVDDRHAAYVLYTSGSTGRAKGVVVTQGNLRHYVGWARDAYAVTSATVAPVHTSLTFDLTVTSLWVPWSAGGRLMLVPEEAGLPGLATVLAQAPGPVLLKLTPAHLRGLALMGTPVPRAASLVVGGEALDAHTAAGWSAGARVWNEYGPTETTVGCCVYEVSGDLPAPHVPIGTPIRDTSLRVLNAEWALSPEGVAGTLHIGGAGVARCYLDRPALTAERFLPDPFSTIGGARLYCSGDRTRWLRGGRLDYLGRVDDQIKLRGYRIELGEIEAILRDQPEISEAAVVLCDGAAGQSRLVAYIAPRPGAAPPVADALTRRLRAHLPTYMVPAEFVVLAELPLTVNGKIDRAMLLSRPPIEPARPAYAPPGDPVEEILCGIFEYVLKRDRVSATDNFFELGGDSLLSLQVVARARAAGLSVAVEDVFQEPTVRALAPLAVEERDTVQWQPGSGDVPLTPIQHWFFEQPIEPRAHWNQSVLLSTGPLERVALEKTVRLVIERHDAFRLRFEQREDRSWRQWYDTRATSSALCCTVDLLGAAPAIRRTLLTRCAGRVQRSFDLGSGPLVRVVRFRLNEHEERLLIVAHHLVVDGVSWRVLLEDLQNGYDAIHAGRSAAFGPPTAPYRAWAEALRSQVPADWLRREIEYWKGVTVRSAGWRVDPDHHDRANDESTLDTQVVVAGQEETRWLLQDLRSRHGAQIQEAIVAALARSIARWIGRDRVLFDFDSHGRHDFPGSVDVTRTVGWFTNLYPVYLTADVEREPHETLRSAVDELRRIPRGGIGYQMLRYLAGERDLGGGDARAVAFNYLGQLDQVLRNNGWKAAAESHGRSRSRLAQRTHDLEIIAAVRGGRLHIEWSYSLHRFRREAIRAVAYDCLAELHALASALAAAPPMALAERDQPREQPVPPQQRQRKPPASPQPRPARLPLSFAQQRIWFLDQLKGHTIEYNIPESLRLLGPLHFSALARAFEIIVERHEILRTRFVAVDGQPSQTIDPPSRVPVPIVDLAGLTPAGRRALTARQIRREAARPFDLAGGPLLRVHLLKLGEQDHVLLRTTHHMVSDRWSQGLFNREFNLLYEAMREGRPNPLAPLPLQYADFTLGQLAWLRSGAMARGVAYWQQQLADIPMRLELPADRARPQIQTFAGAECRVIISREQLAGVKRLATRHHVTLYMTLLAAFGALLSRYAGQTDIVIGTSVANRQDPQLERLIGLFVNNVVLRMRAKPSMRFDVLLAEVRRTALDAFRYQDIPFERIVDELSPERSLAATPVYQVLFGLQNTPWEGRRMDTVEVQVLPEPELHVHLDLEVLALERGGELLIAWHYNRDLFDAWRIEQMASHYVRLLAAVVEDAHAPIGRLDLLDSRETRQIVGEWNATACDVEPTTLPRLFEAQVRRTPDAVALVTGDASLSYAALNRRANQLARLLIDAAVGPEDVVALALPRSDELIVAMLAAVKAGAAYLPLDPAMPVPRLAFMLDDARPRCVLTAGALAMHLPTGPDCRVIVLDDPAIAEHLSRCSASDTSGITRLDSRNIAYVIYTSGSTGKPKGTTIAQHGAVDLLGAFRRRVGLDGRDVSALFHALTFDLSLCEIWTPLLYGGRAIIVPQLTSRSPAELLDLLAREQVTVLCQTPTELYQLVQADSERPEPGARLALRTIVAGGEALESSRLRGWFTGDERRPVKLINFYGPSEVTVGATMHVVDAADLAESAAPVVPIGRPLANYRVYVVDAQLNPVPVGVTGELVVGAAGLARSYWKRPALTAERFLPDPFGTAGGRVYGTGDRGRWLPGGTLEFLGRADDQVKLRGIRIEPGEIEMALLQQPGVQHAAVVLREDEPGDKRLVAYVVAGPAACSPGELRARVQAVLPDYMVPAAVVPIDRLPLMPSGKLDRKALPRPERTVARERAGAEVAPPRDGTEAYLKQLWEEVLDVHDLDIRDNFFAVGGHSMNSVVMMSRLSRMYGRKLAVAAIFQYPTIEQLARFLRHEVASQPPTLLVPIQPRGTRPPLFLVHPAGGLANVYVELGRQLGPDQPVYAFQARGFDDAAPHRNIEIMARAYVAELRATRHEGPYLLGGWSMGGVVAFEMAQQLISAGEHVSLLALLDTVPSSNPRRRRRAPPPRNDDIAPAQYRRLEALLAAANRSNVYVPPDITVPQFRRFRQVFASNFWAERSYRFGPFSGPITLISTRQSDGDPTRGWEALAPGRVVVHQVAAPHHELVIGAHAAEVAPILRASIDRAVLAGVDDPGRLATAAFVVNDGGEIVAATAHAGDA